MGKEVAKYTAEQVANWLVRYNDRFRDLGNKEIENITNLKLQRLLYCCQGVYLVEKNKPLFNEKFYNLETRARNS